MEQRRIRITVGDLEATVVLNNSLTSDMVWSSLPIEASVSTWGDEIYFSIAVIAEEDDARETVGMGDVGFWPPRQVLCLFFGPTPASRGDEI